jgi:serine/threonine protein phosphatase PrpC
MRGSLTESTGVRLRVEKSEISLIGARESNQDRVATVISEQVALLVVCDGMGGHSDGERAATITEKVMCERFRDTAQPLLDPLGFLHLALGAAHQRVVQYGFDTPLEVRPRATCAVCLVQDGAAYWAHVGDSRIYLLRHGHVIRRTRDHSHVELLLREGLIQQHEMQSHPMRNFVESCIGGEAILPEMSIGLRQPLQPGDVLLACTDGLWGNLDDAEIATAFAAPDRPLADTLKALAERAVRAGGAASDNTSAAVLRFLE